MKNRYTRFLLFLIPVFVAAIVLNYSVPSALAYSEDYQEGIGTYVFGELLSDTTWFSSKAPYIAVGAVTVPSEVTLTIEPGTTVKFDGYYQLVVNGTLNAIGEKNNLITLTSNKSNPAKYDWRGVRVNSGGESIFKYSVIEYANEGITTSGQSPHALVSLTNSIIRHGNIALYGLQGLTPVVKHNEFYDIDSVVAYYVNGLFVNNNIYNFGGDSNGDAVFFSSSGVGINAVRNNIIGVRSDDYFVRFSSANNEYTYNYWGTTDDLVIASRMSENVNYKPIADSYITFDVNEPANDSEILSSATSNVDFSWSPINGSGHELDYYNLYIDNELVASSTATSTNYDITELSGGYHQWYVEAVNNDATTYRSNNVFGFNLDYITPVTPIATTDVNCNEINGTIWCYEDVNLSLTAINSDFITYTLDGSTPTAITSETNFLYSTSTPILLASSSSVTIKAKGWKNVDESASVGGALLIKAYSFDLNKPTTPQASPIGGVHDNKISVTLSSSGADVIRYTMDGSSPNSLSSKYSSPIFINKSVTLKAKAWNKNLNDSSIMSENYFITNASGGGSHEYYADLSPLISPGAYISKSGVKDIVFTSSEDTAKICYTKNGETPTEDSVCVSDRVVTVPISTGDTNIKVKTWSNTGAVNRNYNADGFNYLLYDHGTEITSSIHGVTTWTVAESPYIIKANSFVGVNSRLVIEPGVNIILNNSSSIRVDSGSIEAIGSMNSSINIFGYNQKSYIDVSNGVFKYVNFNNIRLALNNSNLSYSNLANYEIESTNSSINNSSFTKLKFENYSYLRLGRRVKFYNNKIDLDRVRLSTNFYGETDNIAILKNNFYKTDGVVDFDLFNIYSGDNIKINDNNFNFTLDSDKYIIKNNSDKNINARNNYWGSDSDTYINKNIYDYNDDTGLGLVDYQGALNSPNTFNLIFPLGQTLTGNKDIIFTWEQMVGPHEDVSHYELYLDDAIIADNLTTTSFSYLDNNLTNGNHSWHVRVIKKDGTEHRENASGSFIIDNAVRYVVASHKGGTYLSPQRVSLGFNENDSVVRYTLDGTEPTITSFVYVNPIPTVTSGTTTIKAKAWYGGLVSETTTEQYSIETNPPLIIKSTAIISFSDVSYNANSDEGSLQGIINSDNPSQNQAVGLVISLDKPATCKYSVEKKDFTEINNNWYDSREGIFRSAHGTNYELIAPLGNLSPGDYKFYVTCSDGMDESSTLIQFRREANAIEMRPILSPSAINSIKKIATADNTWNNGWKWVFEITVPSDETMFKMKFNNWTASYNSYNGGGGGGSYMNNYISAGNNIRYYSPQATTANTPDSAILITESNVYPDTAISLSGDARQDIDGRQIQVFVEMKVPTGTPNGSYSSNYSIYSE